MDFKLINWSQRIDIYWVVGHRDSIFVCRRMRLRLRCLGDVYFQNSNAISDYELRSALFHIDIDDDVNLPSIIVLFCTCMQPAVAIVAIVMDV